jgi:hypothetical protein
LPILDTYPQFGPIRIPIRIKGAADRPWPDRARPRFETRSTSVPAAAARTLNMVAASYRATCCLRARRRPLESVQALAAAQERALPPGRQALRHAPCGPRGADRARRGWWQSAWRVRATTHRPQERPRSPAGRAGSRSSIGGQSCAHLVNRRPLAHSPSHHLPHASGGQMARRVACPAAPTGRRLGLTPPSGAAAARAPAAWRWRRLGIGPARRAQERRMGERLHVRPMRSPAAPGRPSAAAPRLATLATLATRFLYCPHTRARAYSV